MMLIYDNAKSYQYISIDIIEQYGNYYNFFLKYHIHHSNMLKYQEYFCILDYSKCTYNIFYNSKCSLMNDKILVI